MRRERDASPNLLLVMTAAIAGVVLIVLALAAERWWLLVPALAVHGLAAAMLLGYVGRHTAQGDEPEDPIARERVRDERSGEHEDLRTQPERVGERGEH